MGDKRGKRLLMIRRKTIVAGGIYHITQRAPGREELFLEDDDRLRFIALLKKCANKYKIDIFAFSLMPNHLHILLKINEENLSKSMKYLFEKYAVYFNSKYQRKGHVFCGRYRAAFCNDENYLLTISVYIHLNSYKAKLVKSPFEYRWHSLDIYVKSLKSSFIKNDMVLSLLHSVPKKAKEIYRDVISGGKSLKYVNILEEPDAVRKFYRALILWFKKNFSKKEENYKDSPFIRDFLDIERKIKDYKGQKMIKNPKERKALRYLIQQLIARGYTRKEISEKVNIDRSTVYRFLNAT